MRKRTKRLLCAALSAVMVTAGTYAADYSAKFNREDNSITMESKIEESGYGVFVYILKGKLAETEKVSDVISKDTLMYADVITGKFNFPSTAADGVYTVVFGEKAAANESERRIYVLKNSEEAERDGVIDVLRAQSAQEMLEKLLLNNDRAYILDLNNAGNVSELLYDAVAALGLNQKESPSLDDLKNVYSAAEELFEMRTADASDLERLLISNKEVLGLDENIEKYSAAVAAGIIRAKANGRAFSSFSEEKGLAYECLALAALNNAGSSGLYETIEKYNSVFNVTFSANKQYVSEYEVAKLITADFDDVSKVGSIVNAAIDAAYKNKNNSGGISPGPGGGGGGGTGGSGSSSGGGGYSAPSLINREELAKTVGESTDYKDTDGYSWAIDAIKYLSEKKIMSGDGNGIFRPGDTLTREELVKIIIEAFGNGKTETAQLNFEDVKDEWYEKYIETAYKNGIVNGVDEKTFGVGSPVTRADACVMLTRAAEAYYKTFNKKETLIEIADFDLINEYAKASVDMLLRAGIVSGFEDGTFKPEQNITRAQAAKMIYSCLTNLGG